MTKKHKNKSSKNKKGKTRKYPLFLPLLILTFILGCGIFSLILGSTVVLHVHTTATTLDDFHNISEIHDESVTILRSILDKDNMYTFGTVDKQHIDDTIYHIIQFDGHLSPDVKTTLEEYDFSHTTIQINILNWGVALSMLFSAFVVLFMLYKHMISDKPNNGYLKILLIFSVILVISGIILARDTNFI